jgi:hypothetical protein
LTHAEMLDFMDLFLEHFSRVNRLGAVSRVEICSNIYIPSVGTNFLSDLALPQEISPTHPLQFTHTYTLGGARLG